MSQQVKEYDVLGVGFGPANLSIAIALEETSKNQDFSYCFLEQKPHFEWHGGMLLDGTRMQISCMKDLVTLRNPTSPYSFVNYLHSHNRLSSFINLGSLHPSRVEFNDYLTWVANQFESVAAYGQRVIDIEPIEVEGSIKKVRVISTDIHGNRTERIAKNILVGMGGMPKLPKQFDGIDDEKVIHSSKYKVWCEKFDSGVDLPRIAVVGAGQSAAEIFVDLTNRFDCGEIHLVNRNFALHPADDSAFVNEIFDPEFTDHIYSSSQQERESILSRFNGTNYSVVDTEELGAIYERLYLQRVTGEGLHKHLRCHDIQEVAVNDTKVSIRYHDRINNTQKWDDYDAVVLATGYRYDEFNHMLDKLAPFMSKKQVERHYRLPMKDNCDVNIFLQGCCESSHGISDTLLSVLAVRSKEIVDSLYAKLSSEIQAVKA
ncbi:lysine N(6)-hydroxylase/L-ornithine N(5)-oxygenase family protein [Vibrio caribbeanicus]|uniref:lysine N(6)-hydroxylase/L-ornithine N(5)-oxygenase family protein n=1 Tax=Vibrio caribbeanicus TaxID=701175 RepID=UPI0030DDC36B